MSWGKARDGIKMAEVAVRALEIIQGLTKAGGDAVPPALGAIRAVLQTVHDGFDGKTTPELVIAELEAMRVSVSDNDLAADLALRDRFDTSDVTGSD